MTTDPMTLTAHPMAPDAPRPITPARIRKSAASELHALADGVLSVRVLVVGLLRISQDPKQAGQPLGSCEGAYYRELESGVTVLYTLDEHGNVTIEGFRRVLALW